MEYHEAHDASSDDAGLDIREVTRKVLLDKDDDEHAN